MSIWGKVVGPNRLDALESWLLVRRWIDEHGFDRTMELAVGGDDRFGDCELAALDHFGFRDGDYLIDVGCGSGRLTRRIAKLPACRYLGTDINRAMVNHARATCGRSDFRFARIDGLKIPEEDGKADVVAFFSVGTHLLNEEFFVYLEEARRVLRPGGRIVFSFLDLKQISTRATFMTMVQTARVGRRVKPLNIFFGPDAIGVWTEMLGMTLIDVVDGSDSRIVSSERINAVLEPGTPIKFGQSIAVLEKGR